MMEFGLLKENMINIMMRIIVTLAVVILSVVRVNAQDKYGADEQKCKENLSMFREYYKQKNYIDAYNPWMWSFINCPQSSQNIYKNASKIIKEKIKADKANKLAYIDTLMIVYDQRIKYFGQEGYVLGLKGFDLIQIDKNRSEEALNYLKKSLDLEEKNASVQAVYGYMRAMVNLEKLGVKSKLEVLEAYALVSQIIDFNIINESKASKNFIKYSDKVESLFTPYANCDDLIDLYALKFDPKTIDINLLRRITKLLSDKKCTSSDLFYNTSSRLYQLEPSASSAYQMSKMSITRGKSSDAIAFAIEAID